MSDSQAQSWFYSILYPNAQTDKKPHNDGCREGAACCVPWFIILAMAMPHSGEIIEKTKNGDKKNSRQLVKGKSRKKMEKKGKIGEHKCTHWVTANRNTDTTCCPSQTTILYRFFCQLSYTLPVLGGDALVVLMWAGYPPLRKQTSIIWNLGDTGG